MRMKTKFLICTLLILNIITFSSCGGGRKGQDKVSAVSSLPAAPYDIFESHSPSEEWQNTIVYITNTGMKCHQGYCRYLNQSKISVSFNELDLNKYSPCSVCNPPE